MKSQLSPRPRGRSGRRVQLSLLQGLVVFLSGCAAYSPPRVCGEKIHRDIVFASPGGRDLRLDLYLPPKSTRPAPVVLWVFGGSWKLGSRGYHLNVRDLTRHGIAIAAIDYRLSNEAKYPAQLRDCQAALHWLQANGAQYGLDPTRIAAAGESSGGHLAALLGTIEGREKIRAVFALYPVTDLVKIGRQYAQGNPSDIERLLARSITSAPMRPPSSSSTARRIPSSFPIKASSSTTASGPPEWNHVSFLCPTKATGSISPPDSEIWWRNFSSAIFEKLTSSAGSR